MTFQPTDEQLHALELFRKGETVAIEAGAGCGKTSTLRILAESTDKRGIYTAFNKSIVSDTATSMPGHIQCSTAHSLAFRAVGRDYAHRLQSPRMRSQELAQLLRVDPFIVKVENIPKVLQPGYLAGLAMRSLEVFCQSADLEPSEYHVSYVEGIDFPDEHGSRTYENNGQLRRHLVPYMRRAWEDIQKTDGSLPFRHSHYLKIWQMSRPTLNADAIYFDEAQDASPVMLDVILGQTHAQLIFVGDSQQEIYQWAGAIDALKGIRESGVSTAFLSKSFRFGQEIADVANEILAMLDAELVLTGSDLPSIVGPLAEPDAILTRTNAQAVQTLLVRQAQGLKPHLVGGGADVVSFARGAQDLKRGRNAYHPDLACFDTWGQVQEYVQNDAQGHELKLLVELCDEYSPDTIINALEKMPTEAAASVVISTAHKAKGREWSSVQLAPDFPDEAIESDGELRLLYVAATRAKRELDVGSTILGEEAEAKPERDEARTEDDYNALAGWDGQ